MSVWRDQLEAALVWLIVRNACPCAWAGPIGQWACDRLDAMTWGEEGDRG